MGKGKEVAYQAFFPHTLHMSSAGDAARAAFAEAFRKLQISNPSGRLTVKDIAALSGYDRHTFYYYFNGIHDLMEWVFDEEASAVLSQCGGIYLDATTLVTSDGAFCFDELPLYTCRTGIRPELDVAKGLWVSYIFAGGKGNGLASYMTEMFSEYWKKEDKLITYLLVDCAIALAYENIPWVREMIDSLPESNSEIYELEDNSRGPYSDDVYRRALSCPFHKMTYKRPHMCECADGTQTIYGRLTEDIKSGKL